ncbi:hypothetical protein [Haliscomenobacter hydrossis]|uniref:hypothetical protein n=1 Tax=Haliscomenobacter hydrossis TaxID=2350 RepID=UPI0002D5708A|nr:hypothetical protein [Haliscomenobacter hydrossis]
MVRKVIGYSWHFMKAINAPNTYQTGVEQKDDIGIGRYLTFRCKWFKVDLSWLNISGLRLPSVPSTREGLKERMPSAEMLRLWPTLASFSRLPGNYC